MAPERWPERCTAQHRAPRREHHAARGPTRQRPGPRSAGPGDRGWQRKERRRCAVEHPHGGFSKIVHFRGISSDCPDPLNRHIIKPCPGGLPHSGCWSSSSVPEPLFPAPTPSYITGTPPGTCGRTSSPRAAVPATRSTARSAAQRRGPVHPSPPAPLSASSPPVSRHRPLRRTPSSSPTPHLPFHRLGLLQRLSFDRLNDNRYPGHPRDLVAG